MINIKLTNIAAALAALLFNGILFMQYASASFPVIVPNTENYLNKAEIAQDFSKKINMINNAIEISPQRALPYIFKSRYIAQKNKAITPEAVRLVEESYEVAPLSPLASEIRLNYIFQNWQLFPYEIKLAAINEAANYSRIYHGREFLKRLQDFSSPDADFALSLAISQGAILNK